MSENHTPTPWRVEPESTQIWNVIDEHDETTYALGYPIVTCRTTPCSLWAKGPSEDEGLANADFIVTAVNSYASSQAEIERLKACLADLSEAARNACNAAQHTPLIEALFEADRALSGSKE